MNRSIRISHYSFLFIILLCLFAALLATSSIVYAEPALELEQVTVSGQAMLSSPDPKKSALQDAFRKAVEQAVGSQVRSDTIIQNAQLIKDRILTRAEGYIAKWSMVREERIQETFNVEITAQVGKGTLNKELFMNGIDVEMVYDWIGKPRMLVLITDYLDNKPALTAIAQTEIEGIFKSKGITVLSDPQLKAIKKRDAELAFGSPEKAKALGNRFGAEIVIVGKCMSNFSRELDISGFKQIFYSSVLEAKAYRTSNAEILMSAMFTEKPGETDTSAMGKSDASHRSMENIVKGSSKEIVFNVVKHWYDGLGKAKSYQLIVSGLKSSELSKLEKAIAGLQDVSNVHRRSFNRGTVEIEIEYAGEQSLLVETIEANKSVPLTMVGEEPFRISFEKANP